MLIISLSMLEYYTLGSLENRSLHEYNLYEERYTIGEALQLSFVVLPLTVSIMPGA